MCTLHKCAKEMIIPPKNKCQNHLQMIKYIFLYSLNNMPNSRSPWRSILMCNNSTSAGTRLEGTPMFAHVTLHRTFNPLGASAPGGKMRKQVLKDHNFLSNSPIFIIESSTLINLLSKNHCIQYISIRKIVLDLVKGTWHHNFMAGCGSLLWANTCSLWSGIKYWPGAGCLQRQARRSWQ